MSLNQKEFRIGNLINYRIVDKMDERKEWLEVSEIDYDDLRIFGVKEEMNQDYQPIKLTEEWLLKFGFEKSEFSFYKLTIPNKFKVYLSVSLSYNIVQVCQNGNGFNVDSKYVHQLQNLYFSLTGEELTS